MRLMTNHKINDGLFNVDVPANREVHDIDREVDEGLFDGDVPIDHEVHGELLNEELFDEVPAEHEVEWSNRRYLPQTTLAGRQGMEIESKAIFHTIASPKIIAWTAIAAGMIVSSTDLARVHEPLIHVDTSNIGSLPDIINQLLPHKSDSKLRSICSEVEERVQNGESGSA